MKKDGATCIVFFCKENCAKSIDKKTLRDIIKIPSILGETERWYFRE